MGANLGCEVRPDVFRDIGPYLLIDIVPAVSGVYHKQGAFEVICQHASACAENQQSGESRDLFVHDSLR